ncbi:glucuronosyltransferase [Bradyrhizobium sp. 38]|jgi:UDP-N-acetylglucosamine transferase subunit ALG13|uniref:glycosyltransferase n=1 Tax=unclassified Bradyrhizobium TaxID=2631580 RepID=UPI001FF92264|nr:MULTISPECIES: glycosyltransferase [unclassified Bradyrhizobium]MCK1335486.1 glucuronosyltransferase [Bradyrhizobium sp. 38]MCK1776823.1 glucuronosyltransferase [Bradyrhizobium sp. 132]
MIFVTVGTQGQFDRLIRTIDEWAGVRGRTDVFAQTGPSAYRARHICVEPFIDPSEFRSRVESASLVVAHAGMGSIITALELGKQIIVMPRRADLSEHRNDHQLASAKRFAQQGRIIVALDEKELIQKLDRVSFTETAERLGGQASSHLIGTIRAFLDAERIRFENRA